MYRVCTCTITLYTLFVLSRLLSSLWVSRTGSASDSCALQEALYKCIDTIQYNNKTIGDTRSELLSINEGLWLFIDLFAPFCSSQKALHVYIWLSLIDRSLSVEQVIHS